MDDLIRSVTGGNVILKIIGFQVVAAAFIVLLLRMLLNRELFLALLERVAAMTQDRGRLVREVAVLTAFRLSAEDERRLMALLRQRCPSAVVVSGRDMSLGGGLVLRFSGEVNEVLDFSFLSRVQQLFRSSCP